MCFQMLASALVAYICYTANQVSGFAKYGVESGIGSFALAGGIFLFGMAKDWRYLVLMAAMFALQTTRLFVRVLGYTSGIFWLASLPVAGALLLNAAKRKHCDRMYVITLITLLLGINA